MLNRGGIMTLELTLQVKLKSLTESKVKIKGTLMQI